MHVSAFLCTMCVRDLTRLLVTAVHPSGDAGKLCQLCEEHPASIRFSPCGHTVLCSECAQRAKKCLQCKVSHSSPIVGVSLSESHIRNMYDTNSLG